MKFGSHFTGEKEQQILKNSEMQKTCITVFVLGKIQFDYRKLEKYKTNTNKFACRSTHLN